MSGRVIPHGGVDALNVIDRQGHGLWAVSELHYLPSGPVQLITGGSRAGGLPMMAAPTPGPAAGPSGRAAIGFGSILGPLYLAPYRSLY